MGDFQFCISAPLNKEKLNSDKNITMKIICKREIICKTFVDHIRKKGNIL